MIIELVDGIIEFVLTPCLRHGIVGSCPIVCPAKHRFAGRSAKNRIPFSAIIDHSPKSIANNRSEKISGIFATRDERAPARENPLRPFIGKLAVEVITSNDVVPCGDG